MLRRLSKNPHFMLSTGLAAGLLVGAGMLVGSIAATSSRSTSNIELPETLLHATASHSTDTFAIATGPVGGEMEGLFTLDYLSGDLRCFVLHPRNIGGWAGAFQYNVINDLQLQPGKTPKFLMVTGMGSFRGSSGAASNIARNLGGSLVYVMDSNTGNFAVYGVPFNEQALNRGGSLPPGQLVRIAVGKAKGVEVGQ